MKRIIVTGVFILCVISFFIFFKKTNYKTQNNGNNINSNLSIEDILNMSSYKAKIELTIVSNKNTNKYIIKQEYEKPSYCMQEVLAPNNIAGVRFTYTDTKLIIENTKLNQKTIYEEYPCIESNDLFLTSFINDYKNDNNSKIEENEDEIILEAKMKDVNKYKTNKKLYINKITGKPSRLEVQDTTQNSVVYILYNEIEIN